MPPWNSLQTAGFVAPLRRVGLGGTASTRGDLLGLVQKGDKDLQIGQLYCRSLLHIAEGQWVVSLCHLASGVSGTR